MTIQDEFTTRADLTPQKKWRLRNPGKYKNILKANNKKRYRSLSDKELSDKREAERERWSRKTPSQKTELHLKKRYKITLEEWYKMFEEQGHRCKICDVEVLPLLAENTKNKGVVDHCHETKKVRGILCHDCNRALGLLKENKESINRMLKYLKDFSIDRHHACDSRPTRTSGS